MNTYAEKTPGDKNQSVANSISQKQSEGDSIFQFVDNRPEASTQRRLQKLANSSPQVSLQKAFQAMANSDTVKNNVSPIQAKWIKVRNSGDPGQYYWEGSAPRTGYPPNFGQEVAPPNFQSLPDSHSARSGGSMKSLRTKPDYPEQNLDMLAHFAYQASEEKGLFYNGPLEKRGLGPQRVKETVPYRNPSEHRNIFSQMTGGQPSSTLYQQQLGTANQDTSYQILHGFGFGEGGQQTQSRQNLSSASEGANSEMIPFDKTTSGNTNVINNTYARVRPGTERAESMHMSFAHASFPETPFFERDIDGDLPKPTKSQYEQWEESAPQIPNDPEDFFASAALFNMTKQEWPEDMDMSED